MKLYLNFFNEKTNKKDNFIFSEFSRKATTSLNHFSGRIYLEELSKIQCTEVLLIILDKKDKLFEQKQIIQCSRKDDYYYVENLELNENIFEHKFYIQIKNGGILVYNGYDNSFSIDLKNKIENTEIKIYNSLFVDGIYEIQNSSEELVDVSFEYFFDKKYINNKFSYAFNNEKNFDGFIKYNDIFESSIKVNEELEAISFEDNVVYLHTSVKDEFQNIKNDSYKIMTKKNSFFIFNILTTDVFIASDEEFSIRYEERNIKSVIPCIEFINKEGEKKQLVSSKSIGISESGNGILKMKLGDYFEGLELSEEIKLLFKANGGNNILSNVVKIHIDVVAPVITFDDGESKLEVGQMETSLVKGSIYDKNLFYIDEFMNKYNLKELKHYLYVYSEEELQYAMFSGTKSSFIRFGNYYIGVSNGKEFYLYDSQGIEIDKTGMFYINDYADESEKILYAFIDKKKLSTHEENIIDNSGKVLSFSGSLGSIVTKTNFIDCDSFYLIQAFIPKSNESNVDFKLEIEDFAYDFSRYITSEDLSCEVDKDQKISLLFKNTVLLGIKNIQNPLIKKINDRREISTKRTYEYQGLIFVSVSLDDGEYIASEAGCSFFDNYINKLEYQKIYSMPKLKNGEEIELINYELNKIDDENFKFSFETKIESGLNERELVFQDINGNETVSKFSIELKNKDISFEIDNMYNNHFNKVSTETEDILYTNKDSIILKVIVNNESSLEQKEEPIVYLKGIYYNQSNLVKTENGKRVVYFNIPFVYDNSEMDLIYNDTIIKRKVTLVKQEELIAKTEKEFISGMSYYYLNMQIDDFCDFNFTYDNADYFKCTKENGKIHIIQNTFSKMFKKINIAITVFDKKHIYKTKELKVSGLFYNHNITYNHKIGEEFLHNDQIVSETFDLYFNTYDSKEIKEIVYKDFKEKNISDRNKSAEKIEENKYVIKGITTPVLPESLEIYVKLNENDIQIPVRIFETKQIRRYSFDNNIETFVSAKESKATVKIVSSNNEEIRAKNYYIYLNGNIVINEEIKPEEVSIENTIEVDSSNLVNEVRVELNDFLDKTVYVKNYPIYHNYFANATDNYLVDFEYNNIKTKEELKNVKLVSKIKAGKLYFISEDILGQNHEIELTETNDLSCLDYGIHRCHLVYKNYNKIKTISQYVIEVVDSSKNRISYSKDFLYVNEIAKINIHSTFNYNVKYVKPVIEYYLDGEYIYELTPEYIDEHNISFDLDKRNGLNTYVYKDKIGEIKLGEITKAEEIIDKPIVINKCTSVHNTMYKFYKDEMALGELDDVMLLTENVEKLEIQSVLFEKSIKNTIIKYVQEAIIYKEYIPCTVTLYNNTGKTKQIIIKKEEVESKTEMFNDAKTQEARNSFSLNVSNLSYLTNNHKITMIHKPKNKYIVFADNYAHNTMNLKYLSFTEKEKEIFVKEIGYESNGRLTETEYKNKIKNKMEELKNEQ